MELQNQIDVFERNGIALFAISYDQVDVLSAFAENHGITYPLLSDEGSAVIRRLGLYNEHLEEQYAFFGAELKDYHRGVPYPGIFLLDESGTIVEKRFQQTHRERETGAGLLEHGFHLSASTHGSDAATLEGGVTVRASLDSPTYRFYQRVWLTVEVEIAPGLHVYGRPVPDGFTPLAVTVAPVEGLVVGEPTWPTTKPLRMEGLSEPFHVYEGKVRLALPLTFQMQSGPQAVKVEVAYQACSDRDCLPPQTVRFDLPVEMLALAK